MGMITNLRPREDQNFLDCLSNSILVLWTNYHQWMYRKTSKWINTIRYTNKNINKNTNKRMKTNIKSVTEHSNTYTNVSLHQNKKQTNKYNIIHKHEKNVIITKPYY